MSDETFIVKMWFTSHHGVHIRTVMLSCPREKCEELAQIEAERIEADRPGWKLSWVGRPRRD